MQRVNFYTAEFKPDRSPLRSVQMLWVLGGVLLLLLIYSIGYYQHTAAVQQQQAQLEQQLEQSRNALLGLLEQQKSLNVDMLRSELTATKAHIMQRKQVLSFMQNQDVGNTTGFSRQLRALAAESQPAVSLTRFALLQGGERTELQGTTSEPQAVPRYVAQLLNTEAFAGSAFGPLNVQQTQAPVFAFTVAHTPPEEADSESP
jgi:hypothetical protein